MSALDDHTDTILEALLTARRDVLGWAGCSAGMLSWPDYVANVAFPENAEQSTATATRQRERLEAIDAALVALGVEPEPITDGWARKSLRLDPPNA